MEKSLLFLIPILLVACTRTTPIIQPKTVSQEVSPTPAPEVTQPEKKPNVVQQKPEKKDNDEVGQKDTSDSTTDNVAKELDSLIDEMIKK